MGHAVDPFEDGPSLAEFGTVFEEIPAPVEEIRFNARAVELAQDASTGKKPPMTLPSARGYYRQAQGEVTSS